MVVSEEEWKSFVRHAIAVQQLNPETTIPETLRKLRYLERYGIDLDADEVELEDQFYDFLSTRLQQGATKSSLNHYIKAMNRWCKFKGYVIHFKQYREKYAPRRIPTTEDIKKMLDECKGKNPTDKRNKTMILLMAKTGLRAKEVCNLTLNDIDWQHGYIIVRGKGGKIRHIPLDDRMLKGKNYPSLKNYIDHWRLNTHRNALFTTRNGEMTPDYLRMIIKKIARKVGLPWIHPHSLRHYAATNWLRAGMNIKIVQELLGHSQLSTTEIY
ncbi:MAG: tyrosine-type recombinase/integrase, partial [Nitrososphaeria archaeon]|nr:tyrosine-type recombinase/integrase [Nitrososphaeria archaeon]